MLNIGGSKLLKYMYIKQPVCNLQISNILSRFKFLNKGANGVLECEFVITRMALFLQIKQFVQEKFCTITPYDITV